MKAHHLRLIGLLVSGALLGKLLGFAREVAMARLLGANVLADGFRGALTAVLLPVALLQGELLPSVLIPLHKAWQEKERSAELSTAMLLLFTVLSVLAAALVYLFAAPWVGVLVAGFSPEAQDLTVRFVRVMSLAIPASVVSACLASIEIACGSSRIMAIRASVQNLGMIAGIGAMALTGHAILLAWSFVGGFAAILLYALVRLWRLGEIAPASVSRAALVEIGGVFYRRMRPLLVVPVADQSNILLERLLASGAVVGTLASLDYARTITETAFYLVSQPLGYVLLTQISDCPDEVRGRARTISQRMLAVAIPAATFLAVFATDITRIVFARGAFDAEAVALTAGALRGIALGLWATTLGWILIRMVNASGRNGRAAAIVVAALGANALVNVALASRYGSFGLGVWEATRGLVVLVGTALALGCARMLLRCAALLAPVAAMLAVAGCAIQSAVEPPLARLACGVLVFAPVTLGLVALYVPLRPRRLLRRLRREPMLPQIEPVRP